MSTPDMHSQSPSGPVNENQNGVNYETISMIKTDPVNHTFMPCGFLKNGQIRPIYGNSVLGRLKRFHHNHGTQPKYMINVTMYNEDENEFKYTMRGVMQNIEVLCQDPHIQLKKNDFIVILCCDGIEQIPQSFINYLTKIGVLDLNLLKEKGFATYNEQTGKYKMKAIQDIMEPGLEDYPKNLLHTFGTVTEDFGIEDNDYFRGRKVNFMFALKHNNDGKINSYKWLLQGVAKYLNPVYIQKLDIGTRPGDYSLAKMYKHMEQQTDCGGCTSEVIIETDNEKANSSWGSYFVTLLQYYEFKQTITYFKIFEGWGGYVMALSGCYSMFRYEAIKGEPLSKFFKLINMQQEPTCWEANEYLVEDRLLTQNVYYQTGHGFRTDFVIDAQGYTDGPHTIELLMKQRRRWSNGFLFGELTTIMNIHNILGFNGQTHSITQRIKMLMYMPILAINKFMGWICPAIMLTQMKYLFIYSAYDYFNTEDFKKNHYEAWKFFTNDPSSMGFQSVVNLTIFFLLLFAVLASIGAQINNVRGYFVAVLIFFQCYTFFCQIGTYNMVKNFGFYDKEGHFNVYVFQFVLMWGVLFCPFYFRPIDAMTNIKKYLLGLPCYYFSYFWWYISVTIYSMCNLDDVSWGNRPANKSKGLNVVVDDKKRQEILRQSYRTTRTNILIWWLFANVLIMYIFDSLILSAVHNGNSEIKTTCQSIIKGYAYYTCGNQICVLTLSYLHHLDGWFRQIFCSKFIPATIQKKPAVSNDPEAKVLLDETDNEEDFIPPVIHYKKNSKQNKKDKYFETNDDMSFYSDDLESHQFMQKYKKKGGWTY